MKLKLKIYKLVEVILWLAMTLVPVVIALELILIYLLYLSRN